MGRISLWPFDGDSGADSVGSNTLTKTGTVSAVADSPIPSQVNSAGFSGAGRYTRSAPTGVSIKPDMTMGAWIKWTTLDSGYPLVICDDASSNYAGFQRVSGNLAVRAEDGTINKSLTSGTTIVAGTWYWVVFTISSGGVASIYIDGVKDASPATGPKTGGFPAAPYVVVGAKNTTGSEPFNGRVVGAFYDDDEMSEAEIAAEYAAFWPDGIVRSTDRAIDRSINRSL